MCLLKSITNLGDLTSFRVIQHKSLKWLDMFHVIFCFCLTLPNRHHNSNYNKSIKKWRRTTKTSNWIRNRKTATGQKQQQLCIFLSMVQLWKKTRPILSHIKIHEIPNCTFHPFFPWFWLEDNGWLCWFLCDSRGPRGSGETTQPPNCPAQVSEASMSRDFWSYLHCMWGSLGLKKSSWKVI